VFQGILIFALLGVLLAALYVGITRKRRDYEATGSPEDVLTDEEFRRIEFGYDA
jgi:hypothetical protein